MDKAHIPKGTGYLAHTITRGIQRRIGLKGTVAVCEVRTIAMAVKSIEYAVIQSHPIQEEATGDSPRCIRLYITQRGIIEVNQTKTITMTLRG